VLRIMATYSAVPPEINSLGPESPSSSEGVPEAAGGGAVRGAEAVMGAVGVASEVAGGRVKAEPVGGWDVCGWRRGDDRG